MCGEEPAAEAVDRRDPGSLALAGRAGDVPGPLHVASLCGFVRALHQAATNALSQLAGGPLGKRERQDALRAHVVLGDAVAIALHEDAGLAGPGSGLGEDVPLAGADRG